RTALSARCGVHALLCAPVVPRQLSAAARSGASRVRATGRTGAVNAPARGAAAAIEGSHMLSPISRYGTRVIPNTVQTIAAMRERGTLVRGPEIAEFERAFADLAGARHAITASYGRMAFWYLLKAFDLPQGSEVVFPALTFWVIPELARVAGFSPVFADVNPSTFTIDPCAIERVITPRTRAIVPT